MEQIIYRVLEAMYSTPTGTKWQLMAAALERATAASVTTGFDGKGTFKQVPAGSYFVFGLTKLRDGKHGAWCVPVEVRAGASTFFLDQNNLMVPNTK